MLQVEVDLRPSLNPVRDQGFRDTCLAHASSLAHEYQRRSVPLSPEYLHFFATGGARGGCSVNQMTQALRTHGQPVETDCPYLPIDPPSGWKPVNGLVVFRRLSETRNSEVVAVEESIRAGTTPVLGIQLPDPFFNPVPPWVVPANGPIRGLHAVVGVGIGVNNGQKLVLIRNSWGSDWADAGHAWLDSDFLNQHLKEVFILTHEVS